MNTSVNFELAKLLKEKNINIPSDYSLGVRIYEDGVIKSTCLYNKDTLHAPTISEVVMWLYEKYGIWISVEEYKDHASDVNDEPTFISNIEREEYSSPTEAYQGAIEYTLNNLL